MKGFTLETAADWAIRKDRLPFGTEVIVEAPGDDPYGPSVHVMTQPLASQTIEGFYQRQKMMLDGSVEDLAFSECELAGKAAGMFSYKIGKLKTVTRFLPTADKVYLVACTGRISEFEAAEATFAKIVDSFSLTAE